MTFDIDIEREIDGRWIAEVADLPGTLTYGVSQDEAIARVQKLALRMLAERLEHLGRRKRRPQNSQRQALARKATEVGAAMAST